jgi:glycosyltransferase involved in cell wall biosynthesis
MRAGPTVITPLVSVVLPFLDESRFLESAVATVLAQEERRWELLLVDDGSTDGSGDLADRLAATEPSRARVLRHPGGVNRGLPASRNLGIRHARGEFVAFLDADDTWTPDKLTRQVAQLVEHPAAGMACGPSLYRFLGSDRPDEVRPVDPDAPRLHRGLSFARGFVWGELDPPPPSNVLYRADALRRVGGVPEGDGAYEDQRLFVAVAMGDDVYVGDEVLSSYTVRSDSLYGSVADDRERAWENRVRFERWIASSAGRYGWRGGAFAGEAVARRSVARARAWAGDRRAPRSEVKTGAVGADVAPMRRAASSLRARVPARFRPQADSLVRALRRRSVRYGSFRRLTPIAGNWGLDRGQPVDRHYIEGWISQHQDKIRGRVLEVQKPDYARAHPDGVTEVDILDIDAENPLATVIADLRVPGSLPSGRFDCAIVTQTLQFVDDLEVAVANLWSSLAPGGSLLITMPTTSKLEETLAGVEYWRVTPLGLQTVMERACPGGEVETAGYGNILVSTAFLYGLVTDDLRPHELDHYDPIFPTGALGVVTKTHEPDPATT